MVMDAKPNLRGKELTREVAYEKTPDGRETFNITVKDSGYGGRIIDAVRSTNNRACPGQGG
jgi:hypothetical protein